MKDRFIISSIFIAAGCLLLQLPSCRTTEWAMPAEIIGEWHSDEVPVTSRENTGFMQFEFTQGFASADLIIREDKTASGKIGNTSFENVEVKLNGGNPEKTGIAYIVKCGKVGKIFDFDPVDEKGVQLWLCPIKENMAAELRLTEKGAVFPMGDFIFVKNK